MDDLISRKDAIDELWKEPSYSDPLNVLTEARDRIKGLPSAQTEIIRCKDCKWWGRKDEQSYGYCHAIKHSYYSPHWEIDIYRKYDKDFFCADAERRTDEGFDKPTGGN